MTPTTRELRQRRLSAQPLTVKGDDAGEWTRFTRAARRLRLSNRSLRRLILRGDIRAAADGARTLVRTDDVLRVLAAREAYPVKPGKPVPWRVVR
jgi:excisionase family DNA binding protein